MSLGIVFKGPEGIVMAADSRVTITGVQKNPNGDGDILIPATFDNSTKLLRIQNQKYVGVVTYGIGSIGTTAPRTANSFIPEFESKLNSKGDHDRLSVLDFSEELSKFFLEHWNAVMPKPFKGPDMIFLVAGYDVTEPYGKIFEIKIPSNPKPKEYHSSDNSFGPVWGGQLEFTNRLIHGFDPRLPDALKKMLDIPDEKMKDLPEKLLKEFSVQIPYQFLSLQDSVDLSKLLITTTSNLQQFYLGVRGVGGSIDVATITRTKGFRFIKEKEISA